MSITYRLLAVLALLLVMQYVFVRRRSPSDTVMACHHPKNTSAPRTSPR